MLPEPTLPASLAALLGALRPCFTARSFRTFCGLAGGLAAARLVVLLLVAPGAPLLVASGVTHRMVPLFMPGAGASPLAGRGPAGCALTRNGSAVGGAKERTGSRYHSVH